MIPRVVPGLAPALALLGIVSGCAGGPTAGEARHANGALAQQGRLEGGMQEGPWTFWYPDGTVEARGEYHRDERVGTWTHYHPDGSLRMRGEYRGERQQGPWQFWYPGGGPQCRGEYLDGREHGEWTFWSRDGHVQQRGCFLAGKRCLQWSEFGADGAVAARGSYLGDVPVGRWTRGAGDAAQQLDYPLPDGVSHVLELWPDGGVRREGFVRQGAPTGLWVTRHESGALRAAVVFAAGDPTGELVACAAAGEVLARGPLTAGRPAGTWSVRAPDGIQPLTVMPAPRSPWDRIWSDARIVEQEPPMTVAERWLDELRAPREVQPQPVAAPSAPPPPITAPPARLEAPTDPGHWTVRERAELALFRRYYRDGWLPRQSQAGSRYGGGLDRQRLGEGDADLAAGLIGKPLPKSTFPTGDGGTLDLQTLRGKRVLFVMLRGFTSQVCVYCFAQTAELAPLAARWRELDCEVVVMFPGSKSRMQAFAAACASEFGDNAPPYHLVYDPDLALATALGLQGNLARPASIVLDRDGIVRRAYVAENVENVADRPAASELLRWVEATR
ncbi:MAG: redoxin family protein [Planctomycetes bacterium]|nr:redoxin family protein [Planctomycetota bacterium]